MIFGAESPDPATPEEEINYVFKSRDNGMWL